MTTHPRIRLAGAARLAAVALSCLPAAAAPAEPADVEGARDPPLIPRPAGASIYEFTVRERDIAAFALDAARVVQADGRYTLARYRYPPGMSCAAVLGGSEARLREARLRVYAGTSLPDEAARSLGATAVEGWVAGVGSDASGRTLHAMAACSSGGIAAVGHVLVVESKPMTMRGRDAPRPAFDTAPRPPPPGEVASERQEELVFRCAPRVKVQLGPVTPVEAVEGAEGPPGFRGWTAHFAPAAVTRALVLSGSAVAESDGQLVCRYRGEGDLSDPSVTMTRPVPSGRICTRRQGAEEFRCVAR